jgi:ubiquinone/menaquinone biosynthesis C-methylase UbiE
MRLYNYAGYCAMLTDEIRMKAFIDALKNAITPESIVLEIGTGLGSFAILACQLGAKKVYAVEPNVLVNLAKENAIANGVADKIEFIEKMSTDIDLPEKADILICDLRGGLPIFESGIATIIDARQRLLKPNGVMMPRQDKIFLAISEAETFYKENVTDYAKDFFDIKMPSSRRMLTSNMLNIREQKETILTEEKLIATLDYQTIEDLNVVANIELKFQQNGTAHGLRLWFESQIADNIFTNNSPKNPPMVYASSFFPLENPIKIEAGDKAKIAISALFEKSDYSWIWNTQILSENGEIKADFKQSNMNGLIISPSILLKRSEYFQPKRSKNAEIDLFILQKMDGEELLGDIADEVLVKFYEDFTSFDEAMNRVADLAQRYSK